MSGCEGSLREWAPLSDLFNRLPGKSPVGLFFQDVKLTCVDVLPEFIALGTNLGIVYWYDRKSKDLQRLRCENSNSPVTVVKVISTVDFMVACGASDGNINIFQIPKSCPEWVPECLKPKNKQVERYTVSELHKSPISALEWSKNGMKLFSGDKNGVVVLTEIDFYMHLCKSAEILNEAYEVVQLSYYQHNLLISTTYRSIICQKLDKWKVLQIGKKDRKVLGQFGGIFYKSGLRVSDTILYCTRPGLRIWVSDIEGCVQKTLLFKELLSKECPEVPLINPLSENLRKLKPQKEASFGILLPFNDNHLVTYSSDVVYVLDPKEMSVICCISSLRNVLDVAVHKDELFILEGERNLIRVSCRPENTPDMPATPNIANPLSTSFRDLTSKLQSSGLISQFVDGELSIHTDTVSVISAEEALEIPVKSAKSGSSDSDSPDYQKKFELYSKIGQRQFEDTILFKHHRRKRKKPPMSASVTSLSSSGSDDKDSTYTQPTLMNLSTVGVLPDLRSPESILNDIEYKEKILANVLNFDKVKVSVEEQEEQETIAAEELSCSLNVNEEKSLEQEERSAVEEVEGLKEDEEEVNSKEFCIKPFKHIFPEFDKIKYEDLKVADTPACMTIPTDWKLSTIQLQHNAVEASLASDDSLQEWEII